MFSRFVYMNLEFSKRLAGFFLSLQSGYLPCPVRTHHGVSPTDSPPRLNPPWKVAAPVKFIDGRQCCPCQVVHNEVVSNVPKVGQPKNQLEKRDSFFCVIYFLCIHIRIQAYNLYVFPTMHTNVCDCPNKKCKFSIFCLTVFKTGIITETIASI